MRANGQWKRTVGKGALGAMAAAALIVGARAGFGQDGGTEPCGTTVWNLTAGQHDVVGTVTVENDADNLYITYAIDTTLYPDACFGALHVWAGNDLSLIDGGGTDRPSPGQLCQADGGACAEDVGGTSYTFTIPWDQVSLVDVTDICGVDLFVVTHAEVDLDCTDDDGEHETAFGGPIDGPGRSWWFYGEYAICCDFGEPEAGCETAFAKGSHVWTTDRKSNPDSLPSLKLTKNRWGWAIHLTATGETTYDIWAGAGLNKTSNGVKVGTLTVNWDGTDVSATYTMFGGYCMEEVHVYAGDAPPTTIAPGQYGHIAEFDPNAASYTFEGALADTSDADGVWIVAHAVVCGDCE